MNKNIKIILILVVLVVIVALFLVNSHKKIFPATDVTVSTTTPITKMASTTAQQATSAPTGPKNLAWAVFQKYLGYNKNHDLNGVKSIVYKVSSVCAAAVMSDECKNRMDSAYSYGSALKKADFVNVWSDSKQTILSTNFKIEEDADVIGRNRAIIFFIGEQSTTTGKTNLKLLSFSPFRGVVLDKDSSTREELLSKLTLYTQDKDEDGIADYDEQCIGAAASSTCVKTDPTLRDTNGNGWWDGVEALMNQKI